MKEYNLGEHLSLLVLNGSAGGTRYVIEASDGAINLSEDEVGDLMMQLKVLLIEG